MQETIILVDFFANWCGPCKILTPVLESVIKEDKKAILIKVNVDEAPKISEKYQVTSLPTVKAFKGGKEVGSFVGARDKAFVKKFISSFE